jgi:5-methylcytosine-specific restriction enzyme A
MPHAPARPCTYPGCSALVDGTSRCPQHSTPRKSKPGPNTQRTFTRRTGGYDRTWRRIVAEAIQAEPWCHWPSGCYATEDLTGDHIVPLSKGGLNERSNCEVLCRAHNSAKRDRMAGRTR